MFDHFKDVDVESSIAAQVSVGAGQVPDGRGSIYYKKTEAKTFATFGAGEITIRSNPSQTLVALKGKTPESAM